MRKTRVLSILLSAVIVFGSLLSAGAAGVSYLPDVTREMTNPAFWSKNHCVLMSFDEINAANAEILAAEGTNMYDLKNHPETVDGVAVNSGVLSSSKADVAYYLGWTYFGEDEISVQEDYDPAINNTQNPNPEAEQAVLYAVAVKRTGVRVLPSPLPIWDDLNDKECDYQYLSYIRVNEPVIITSVSADGCYYLAKTSCCSGWVSAEDVAICKDKEEWLSAWDIEPENVLVVYGDRVYTEVSMSGAQTSELMLPMGTVLELADLEDPRTLIDNRAAYQNYAVWVPVKNDDGSYAKKLTLISENEKVHPGYLPVTEANIAAVALESNGNTYGWGGGLESEDCSSYIRSIYKCFGLELARNTTWQTAMPMAKISMSGMCRDDRIAAMDSLPTGSILYFSGHEMLYLGSHDDNYYVISAVGNMRDPLGGESRQRIRSIVINTLDIKRANGVSWLDSLTDAIVPWLTVDEGADYGLPEKNWYHEGVEFCISKGLMTSYDDELFHPHDKVTQAQMIQVLWNMAGKPGDSDEADGPWYAKAAHWAKSEGLVSDDFDPTADVTREQLAAVLYKYAQKQGQGFTGMWMFMLDFDDIDEISDGAYEPLCWLSMKGVITGIDEDHIAPGANVTRAQFAVMLQRFSAVFETSEQ